MDCSCDRCGKVFLRNDSSGGNAPFQHFSFVSGPASGIGGGKRIEASICEECMLDLIRDFCRVSDSSVLNRGLTPISKLGVSRYTLHCLVGSGVTTIEQLCRMEEIEVKKAAGGSSSFREVVDALQAKSFKLAA